MEFQIPDFTEAERRVAATALRERYKSDLLERILGFAPETEFQ